MAYIIRDDEYQSSDTITTLQKSNLCVLYINFFLYFPTVFLYLPQILVIRESMLVQSCRWT